MVHVTFCSSGAGSLRQALGILDQRRKVVDLADDLSWGPLAGGNPVERESWLNLVLPWETNLPFAGRGWDGIDTAASELETKLESSDEHLVWVAPQNARELCGLHWYLDRFGGDKASFIVVEHGFPGTWQGQAPRGIGELGTEQFRFLLENADREAWDEQRFPRCRWAQLCNEATNLRIANKGSAKSVPDDFFDDALLAHCSTDWRRLHRVVGDAMVAQWHASHNVGDTIWLWRLRELASQGKIIASREIVYGAQLSSGPIFVRLGD